MKMEAVKINRVKWTKKTRVSEADHIKGELGKNYHKTLVIIVLFPHERGKNIVCHIYFA